MGTTVFSPGLLPVIHGNTPGNPSYGIDVQLGTGGPLVLDPSTALIVLALFGALGLLVLVLSCTVLVLSLTVAAQSTNKDLSTRTFANAVTALFRCTSWIIFAVYAVCRHVYRLARVVYRASPLKHAVAIVQDVYFAALAVLNIVWHAGEAFIFALYLTGLVILKLTLVIMRFAQAAHALFAPLLSLLSTAYSISSTALQYMTLYTSPMCLCVYAYGWHVVRVSGKVVSMAVSVIGGLLSYLPALLTLVCLTLTTVSYILLALLVKFALLIAAEQPAPSIQADKGVSTMVIFKVHHTPQVNNVVSIRPKLHIVKFHPLVRSYRQEESIMSESYQVDNVSDSLAIVVCSAWILTLLGNLPLQLEQSRAENTASGTGRQLCIRRDNVLAFNGVNVMDTTAYIEEVNDDYVVATDGAPEIQSPRDTVPEVSVEYAMVSYGPSPPPLIQTPSSPAFFRGLPWTTRAQVLLACRFVAYGLTKSLCTFPEQVDISARAHRHLAVHLHRSLDAYCSVSRTWASATRTISAPRRLTASDDDGSQLVSPEDEDPDKTLCELVDPAIVLEEPEKTDGQASDIVDIPSQTLVSNRSLDEKVEQRIATITLADKVARNFKLDSLWDDYAKSGSASMALLSKAIVQGLVAAAESSTSPAEPKERVMNRCKSQDAASSCGTPQTALKATASTFVPVALKAAALTESISKSIPESAPSLKATAVPFVPSMSRQPFSEAAELRSPSESLGTESGESKSPLKASAAAFVPSATKVTSTGPLPDSVSPTGNSDKPVSMSTPGLMPTAAPFVPILKSAGALPPSPHLNAAAPQFVPLGVRCDLPDDKDGASSATAMTAQAQTKSSWKGRIPHSVRRARKRAKEALALAEAAAAAAAQQ